MAATDDARRIQVVDRNSGRSLNAWVHELGDDVVVAVGGGDRPRSLHYAAADQPRADGVGWGGGGPVQEEGRA